MDLTTFRGDTARTTHDVASPVRMAALAGVVGPLLFTLAFLVHPGERRRRGQGKARLSGRHRAIFEEKE